MEACTCSHSWDSSSNESLPPRDASGRENIWGLHCIFHNLLLRAPQIAQRIIKQIAKFSGFRTATQEAIQSIEDEERWGHGGKPTGEAIHTHRANAQSRIRWRVDSPNPPRRWCVFLRLLILVLIIWPIFDSTNTLDIDFLFLKHTCSLPEHFGTDTVFHYNKNVSRQHVPIIYCLGFSAPSSTHSFPFVLFLKMISNFSLSSTKTEDSNRCS